MSVNLVAGIRDLIDERDRLKHDRDQWRTFALEYKARIDKAIELHDDPLAGVCPTCISRENLQDGGDGLIPRPCPTHKTLDPEIDHGCAP